MPGKREPPLLARLDGAQAVSSYPRQLPGQEESLLVANLRNGVSRSALNLDEHLRHIMEIKVPR